MNVFKNVLLAQTTDRGIAAHAARAALRNNGQLSIMEVVPKLPRRAQGYELPDGRDINEILVSDARNQMNQLALDLDNKKLQISTKVATGIPFVEIVKEAIRSRVDLVIVEAEGSRSTKRVMFGSMSMQLLRTCPCALWIINSRRKKFRHVGAAIDPLPADKVAENLNGNIIDVADSLSGAANAQLSVLAVWQSLWDNWAGRTGLSSSELAKRIREEQEDVRNRLLKAFDKHRLDPGNYQLHLRRGAARHEIVRFAVQKKIDLMVMGTVCRTGIPGFLIGNTAESVLQHLRCSVLTLKPEGFVSPVTV